MASGSLSLRGLSPRLSDAPSTFRASSARRTSGAILCRTGRLPPIPPLNPKGPFLSKLAVPTAASREDVTLQPSSSDGDSPPYLDLFESPNLMATPAQVERSASYNEHRTRRPPPDLPSLLLDGRIVFIGMPLVPAVSELVIAELMYLQYTDPNQPIYLYINSSGTTRDDDETVAMESEGFAIYDAMMQLKNVVETVCVGIAIGHACLLLAAGKKGRRFMTPHARAVLKQPSMPSSGQLSASDVLVRAKEAIVNRDTLVELIAKHTGNSIEKVAKVMQTQFNMDVEKAIEFGVIDKVVRSGKTMMADVDSPEEWDKKAGIKYIDGI